jgi:hypothetical protein
LIHAGAFLLDIGYNGIADVLREWQSNLTACFASEMQHTRRPVEIAESEPSDIPGPESEAP